MTDHSKIDSETGVPNVDNPDNYTSSQASVNHSSSHDWPSTFRELSQKDRSAINAENLSYIVRRLQDINTIQVNDHYILLHVRDKIGLVGALMTVQFISSAVIIALVARIFFRH